MAERSLNRNDSAGVDPYLKELYNNFGEKGAPPRSLSQELAAVWPADNNLLEVAEKAPQSGYQASCEKRLKKSLPRQFSRSLSEELNILLQEGEQGVKDPPSQAPLDKTDRTTSLPADSTSRNVPQAALRSQSLPSASTEPVAAAAPRLDPASGQAQLEGLLQELQGVLPAM
eukprot:CAMPEP_0118959280 /NCGR_PEP_ID=MMETSP1169-20130426/63052_1 /TAXON_ID=36882 /ORGANISM="Pyramimonas obovata, Strain CCMP722" /LENGTH=171 /DNA_ID=CAMNT_0006907411 /DNA_START=433 /DNA_END=945 /DNA_ORIENTATION=-